MRLRPRILTIKLRFVVVVLATVVVAATAFAGSSAAWPSGVRSAAVIPLLRVGEAGRIVTLDQSRDSTGVEVTSLSLETLMKITPDGKLQPNLAQSVTQPGPATYVYHLRKGVKFWSGNELTAVDVANSLNYYRFPGSIVGFAFTSVKSILAKDRYTVVVTLKHRDAGWKFVPAQYPTMIFEKKFQDEHKQTFGQPGTLIMGTGPWRVVSLDPTRGVELEANPRWWGGQVPIKHISFRYFADENGIALALRGGQIDVAPMVSSPGSFAATSGTKVHSVPSCQAAFLGLGVNTPPWNDTHVRRAVAYAINRQDLATAAGGFVTPLTSFIPPSQLALLGTKAKVTAALKGVPNYRFNLAKARQELAQSKYPNGFSAKTTYPRDYFFVNFSNINQAIAAQLGRIGIKLELDPIPLSQYFGLFGPKDGVGLNFMCWGCLSPDPSWYPGLILGSVNVPAGRFNYAAYAPPAVDTLIAEGRNSTNSAKRLQTYTQIMKRVATDLPYVPLFVKNTAYGISPKYAWPSYVSTYYSNGTPWALGIKAA